MSKRLVGMSAMASMLLLSCGSSSSSGVAAGSSGASGARTNGGAAGTGGAAGSASVGGAGGTSSANGGSTSTGGASGSNAGQTGAGCHPIDDVPIITDALPGCRSGETVCGQWCRDDEGPCATDADCPSAVCGPTTGLLGTSWTVCVGGVCVARIDGTEPFTCGPGGACVECALGPLCVGGSGGPNEPTIDGACVLRKPCSGKEPLCGGGAFPVVTTCQGGKEAIGSCEDDCACCGSCDAGAGSDASSDDGGLDGGG